MKHTMHQFNTIDISMLFIYDSEYQYLNENHHKHCLNITPHFTSQTWH